MEHLRGVNKNDFNEASDNVKPILMKNLLKNTLNGIKILEASNSKIKKNNLNKEFINLLIDKK